MQIQKCLCSVTSACIPGRIDLNDGHKTFHVLCYVTRWKYHFLWTHSQLAGRANTLQTIAKTIVKFGLTYTKVSLITFFLSEPKLLKITNNQMTQRISDASILPQNHNLRWILFGLFSFWEVSYQIHSGWFSMDLYPLTRWENSIAGREMNAFNGVEQLNIWAKQLTFNRIILISKQQFSFNLKVARTITNNSKNETI